MKAIDCHVHVFPDGVAEKAVAGLAKSYHITPISDGSVSSLTDEMDETGAAFAVNLPVATKPSQVKPINDLSISSGDDRVINFGAMHPDFPDPETEIDRLFEAGIKGIKMHPNWQYFTPEDPRLTRIYAAAEGRMILCLHAGVELGDWEYNPGTPESIARIHRNHPDLTIIAAHMGGYQTWGEVERHLVGTGVYFDTANCLEGAMPDDLFVRIAESHGPEKILFGSDMPIAPIKTQVEKLVSLPFTEEEKSLMLYENAARLLAL